MFSALFEQMNMNMFMNNSMNKNMNIYAFPTNNTLELTITKETYYLYNFMIIILLSLSYFIFTRKPTIKTEAPKKSTEDELRMTINELKNIIADIQHKQTVMNIQHVLHIQNMNNSIMNVQNEITHINQKACNNFIKIRKSLKSLQLSVYGKQTKVKNTVPSRRSERIANRSFLPRRSQRIADRVASSN